MAYTGIVTGSAATEMLRPAPLVAFPAEFDLARTVSPQALVSFRGNRYSVPPGLGGTTVRVRHRLGADTLRVVTAGGATVAVHHRVPDGAGRLVRDDGHVAALERAALTAFSSRPPCTHKTRRPPSAAALAEAAALRARHHHDHGFPTAGPAAHVVIDLATYAATAARLSTTSTAQSVSSVSPVSPVSPSGPSGSAVSHEES